MVSIVLTCVCNLLCVQPVISVLCRSAISVFFLLILLILFLVIWTSLWTLTGHALRSDNNNEKVGVGEKLNAESRFTPELKEHKAYPLLDVLQFIRCMNKKMCPM